MRMKPQLLEALALHILEPEVEGSRRLLVVVDFRMGLAEVVKVMVEEETGSELVEEVVNCSGQVGVAIVREEVVNCR